MTKFDDLFTDEPAVQFTERLYGSSSKTHFTIAKVPSPEELSIAIESLLQKTTGGKNDSKISQESAIKIRVCVQEYKEHLDFKLFLSSVMVAQPSVGRRKGWVAHLFRELWFIGSICYPAAAVYKIEETVVSKYGSVIWSAQFEEVFDVPIVNLALTAMQNDLGKTNKRTLERYALGKMLLCLNGIIGIDDISTEVVEYFYKILALKDISDSSYRTRSRMGLYGVYVMARKETGINLSQDTYWLELVRDSMPKFKGAGLRQTSTSDPIVSGDLPVKSSQGYLFSPHFRLAVVPEDIDYDIILNILGTVKAINIRSNKGDRYAPALAENLCSDFVKNNADGFVRADYIQLLNDIWDIVSLDTPRYRQFRFKLFASLAFYNQLIFPPEHFLIGKAAEIKKGSLSFSKVSALFLSLLDGKSELENAKNIFEAVKPKDRAYGIRFMLCCGGLNVEEGFNDQLIIDWFDHLQSFTPGVDYEVRNKNDDGWMLISPKNGRKLVVGLLRLQYKGGEVNTAASPAYTTLFPPNLHNRNDQKLPRDDLFLPQRNGKNDVWVDLAQQFAVKQNIFNIGQKRTALKRLLVLFYELENQSDVQYVFDTRKQNLVRSLLISSFTNYDVKHLTKVNVATVFYDFLTFVYHKFCVMHDEDSGDFVPLHEYLRMPIARNHLPFGPGSDARPSNSHRAVMPFEFMEICKEIIQENDYEWAKTSPLLKYDWFTYENPETGLSERVWSPARSIMMLMKLIIPLRTKQVRMLDSGEGDPERYDHVEQQWYANPLSTKKFTNPQGVLRKIYDRKSKTDRTGFFINTNKTKDASKDEEDGYTIPWYGANLIKLINELFDFQVKHFPLSKPQRAAVTFTSTELLNITDDKLDEIPDRYYLFRNHSRNGEGVFRDGNVASYFLALLDELERRLEQREIRNFDGSKIVIITERHPSGAPKNSIYDLHGLRVAGITHLAKTGMDFSILSKFVAGHATILMTLHYTKHNFSYISDGMDEAFETLKKSAENDLHESLISHDLDRIAANSAYTSMDAVNSLSSTHKSAWSTMDWGICPYGGGRCHEGGEVADIEGDNKYERLPVRGGPKSCPLCRFFITGPAWLDGLAAKFNESQVLYKQAKERLDHATIVRTNAEVELLNAEAEGLATNQKYGEYHKAKAARQSALEEVNHLIDLMSATYALIEQSKEIIKNKQESKVKGSSDIILAPDFEIEMSEVTDEEAIDEVCRSATLFPSVAWEGLNYRRLDNFNKLLQWNGIPVLAVGLSAMDQKYVLDHISELMRKRFSRQEIEKIWQSEKLLEEKGARDEIMEILYEKTGRVVGDHQVVNPLMHPKYTNAKDGKTNSNDAIHEIKQLGAE